METDCDKQKYLKLILFRKFEGTSVPILIKNNKKQKIIIIITCDTAQDSSTIFVKYVVQSVAYNIFHENGKLHKL